MRQKGKDKIREKDVHEMYEVCCEWCGAKIRTPEQQDAWDAAHNLKWAYVEMEKVLCYSCQKASEYYAYKEWQEKKEKGISEDKDRKPLLPKKKIRKKDVKRVFVLVCAWCGGEITSMYMQNVCDSANKLKWDPDRGETSEEKFSLCRLCHEKFERGEIE
jgi:predicted restriction endonuclease